MSIISKRRSASNGVNLSMKVGKPRVPRKNWKKSIPKQVVHIYFRGKVSPIRTFRWNKKDFIAQFGVEKVERLLRGGHIPITWNNQIASMKLVTIV